MRMSKQAKLPPQTSPYGPLSTAAMAFVSTATFVIIIVVGGILLTLYVKENKRNLVDDEVPDFLEFTSGSTETTDECVISLSYSYPTHSRESDPFIMSPEYYLNFQNIKGIR